MQQTPLPPKKDGGRQRGVQLFTIGGRLAPCSCHCTISRRRVGILHGPITKGQRAASQSPGLVFIPGSLVCGIPARSRIQSKSPSPTCCLLCLLTFASHHVLGLGTVVLRLWKSILFESVRVCASSFMNF